MMMNLRRSAVFCLLAIVLVFGYTLLGTGISQLFFKSQANGSIASNGSTLIGQNWALTRCGGHALGSCVFHGRPDDTGPYAANSKEGIAGGDNPLVANGHNGESAATNLGPRSLVLLKDTKALVAYWHNLGVNPTPDLVTTSGSGYDPDITPNDALVQIPMIAKATGISANSLNRLVVDLTHGPQLGFLGSSYIDVLQLNEALSKLR